METSLNSNSNSFQNLFTMSTQPLPSAKIFEGDWDKGKYAIEVIFSDEKNLEPTGIKAKVRKIDTNEKTTSKVDKQKNQVIVNYNIHKDQVPDLYLQCPEAFDILITEEDENKFKLDMIFSGKGYVPANASHKKIKGKKTISLVPEAIQREKIPQVPLNLITLNDSRDLASAVKKDIKESRLKELIQKMVDIFYGIEDPRPEQINEIMTIAEVCDHFKIGEQKRIIHKLIKVIQGSVISDKDTLFALANIFRMIQRANYHQAIIDTTSENPLAILKQNPLYQFEMNMLINVMKVLSNKLQDTSRPTSSNEAWYFNNDSKLLLAQMEAFTSLLELMEMAGLDNLERKECHEPFYNAIDKFSFDPNLNIAFQAEYGKQIFTLIPTGESALHQFLRRSSHVINAGIAIYKTIVDFDIDQINNVFNEMKESLAFQDSMKNWFFNLYQLRFIVLTNVEELKKIKEAYDKVLNSANQKKRKKFEKLIHSHNPFFLKGFIELLREVLYSP